MERNDVRDVVRSVSSFDSGNYGIGSNKSPSMLVLEYFINSIHTTIHEAAGRSLLPPESAVHALSALAKPLNKIGKRYIEQPSRNECIIAIKTLESYFSLFQLLNLSFQSLPTSQLLPVSRLALMGLASLSPMFASLVEVKSRSVTDETENHLLHFLDRTLKEAMKHLILASTKIPELAAESTLKATRYDIRGTMRGPGGEDHGESLEFNAFSLYYTISCSTYIFIYIYCSWMHCFDAIKL